MYYSEFSYYYMKVLKKLSFFLVVIPLFFGLLILNSQNASAQNTNCSNGVTISGPSSSGIQKLGSSTKFTVQIHNLSPQANCTYTPTITDATNESGWTYRFATSTTATPQNSISLTVPSEGAKPLVITASPPTSWINNPSYNNSLKLGLKFNGNAVSTTKNIPYPTSYACNSAPSVSVNNSSGTGNQTTRSYQLQLVNKEAAGCPAKKFTVNSVNPTGWSTSFFASNGTSQLSLPISKGPGQSLNYVAKIKAPTNPRQGTYTIKALATNGTGKTTSTDLKFIINSDSNGGGGGGTGGGDNTQTNCIAPKLEITPLNREGRPGVEKQYTVKVTNQDGANCPASVEFTLTRNLPGDENTKWKGRFGSNKLTIEKGKSKSTTLFITSSPNASEGPKTITVKASRSNGKNKSQNITYKVLPKATNVTNPPTKKPTTPPTKKPTTPPTKEPTKGPSPSACVRKTPNLTIDPESRSTNPGGEVSYTVKVKNVDEGPCADRTLTLQRTLPNSNWTGSWTGDNSDFKIAKNVEKTFTLKVKSPNSASVGNKSITITLKNNSDQTVGTRNITYTVQGEITNPPDPDDEYTRLNFVLGVDGIGTTPRVPLGGNKNPDDITRNLNFKLYNAATNTLAHEVSNSSYPFNYNPDSEKFEATYDVLSSLLPDGTYNVFVEGSPFLITQYPGSVSVKKGQTTNLTSPNFYMITGNINNSDQSENKIDILDYNVLISCSIFSKSTVLCDSNNNYSKWSDLNNNGVIDQSDYTLWLREFANQQGAQLPN